MTPALPFLVVDAVISLRSAKSLNSLALGDDLAAGLGERIATLRR
jgi:iron complex transport system permease protein